MKTVNINKFTLYWSLIGFLFCFTLLPKVWYALTYARTTGKIKHFIYTRSKTTRGRISTTWYPIVFFELNGAKYNFLGTDTQHDEFNPGDDAPVLYNPQNPDLAYVYTFPGFWGPALVYFIPVFVVVSAILLSVGFLPKTLVFRI